MEPKPAGWAARYGAWFEEQSAAERYDLRPPYPNETFEVLASLVVDEPRVVLDAGCGPGDLARPLAPLVARVDAVDRSAAMLAKAQTQPGANAPNLHWICGDIESAPLDPPYSLVVCGDSLHWFDWEHALPRFADVLSPQGRLTIVHRTWINEPELRALLAPIYRRHSANPDFAPLDLVEELERRGLFAHIGRHTTAPAPWRPTLDELIGSHHSASGFVLEKMADPDAFDREIAGATAAFPVGADGRFELDVVVDIEWGRPLSRC
jgi:SAM-dependent methyltransferase